MLDKTSDIAVAAESWLAAFENALATSDDGALKKLFHPDSYWRDALALSWTLQTINGRDAILKTLKAQAASKASDEIRTSEQKIAEELRKLGKTVVQVDREAFRKAAIPLHNDASAGAGWSQAQYDEFQALK